MQVLKGKEGELLTDSKATLKRLSEWAESVGLKRNPDRPMPEYKDELFVLER